MDAKILTRLGLLIMSKETKEKRLAALMDGDDINGPAMAALIDECKDVCYFLTDRDSKAVDEHQKIQIRWMLTEIDGKEIVENMDPDELAAWVFDLRENKTIFSASDLGTIAKVMMKRE